MKKSKQITNNKEKIFFVIIFIIITTICYFFPYTHDDWAWGTTMGIERLESLFKNYNGRWAGNILVILLTRSRIFRAVAISATLTGIVYLINKLVKPKNKNINYLPLILLLLMPINVLAQAIAWTSGFANYVIPVLIVLLYIYLNRNIFNEKKIEISNKLSIPLLLLGFVNSLFVEHMTIYNVLLAIVVTVYVCKKEKKLSIQNLCYTIGSIIGTVLMFSNGAYHNIQNATDPYRTIGNTNIIETAFDTYFNELYKLLIHQNTIINIILCVCALIFAYKYIKNSYSKKTKMPKIAICATTIILLGYLCYIFYTKINGGTNIFIYDTYKKYLEGLMIIVYLISLLVISIIAIPNKEKKKRIVFEMISTIIIAGPLLIVTPIGPRCFFPTYAFLILICCEMLSMILENNNEILKKALMTIIVFLTICSFSIYGYSFKIDMERTSYIEEHKNDKKIILPNITHTGYMHAPNPKSSVFKERFKLFYGIDKETEIEFIPYKEWVKEAS